MQLSLGLAQIELHANGVSHLHLQLRQHPLRKHDRVIIARLRTLETEDRYGRLGILLRGTNESGYVAKNRVSVGTLRNRALIIVIFHLMGELIPWQILVIAILVDLKVGARRTYIDQQGGVEPLSAIIDGTQLDFESGG